MTKEIALPTVTEFAHQQTAYAINFTLPIQQQPRIHDAQTLATLPPELAPSFEYKPGRRRRPNQNQTLTHKQCASCQRVLRNDFYPLTPSQAKRNVIYTYCLACSANNNRSQHHGHAHQLSGLRLKVWRFLAPRCAVCQYDRCQAALTLHHIDDNEAAITEMIAKFIATPNPVTALHLLQEANRAIPLCLNCHQELHAGLTIPPKPITRTIQEYLKHFELNKQPPP